MYKLVEVEEKEDILEKPVYLLNSKHPDFVLVVNQRHQVMDAHQNSHTVPGEYVNFQNGIAIVQSLRALEKIRNCESYRKGWITEHVNLPEAFGQKKVEVRTGPVDTGARGKSSLAIPRDKEPLVSAVRGPSKKK